MTDRPPARASVVRAGEGEIIDVAGVRHRFTLTGRDTDDLLGLEEFSIGPGVVGARPHIHWGHDDSFVVLAGRLTIAKGDGEITLDVGDLAHAPRGSVHGFRNAATSEPVRALCIYTPAGYEQYFRDVHAAVLEGTEPTPELLASLRSRYRTDSL